MRKLAYTLIVIGLFLITIGIILQLIQNNCDDKTPKEYFESDVCRYVGNSKN